MTDLLVLSRENDPFFHGSRAHCEKAEWFARLWDQFGYTSGVHVRRVHYQAVSTRVTLPDGTTYENTEKCLEFMNSAAKYARTLGLIAPDAFVDRGNGPARKFVTPRLGPKPVPVGEIEATELAYSPVAAMLHAMLDRHLSPPEPDVIGYDYEPDDQPVHVELVIEKSTMNDVLVPVCEDLGANLITGKGFQSITGAVEHLQRAASHGKPCRVFYISDFDPAGDRMPVAFARQVEFWKATYAPDVEVKLARLALTQSQVIEYDLPRTPIKAGDCRRASFEDRRGEGCVELDALEALHPGALAEVVRQAVRPYRDDTLPSRLHRARQTAWQAIQAQWQAHTAAEQAELEAILTDRADILDQYRPMLREMADALEPISERLEELDDLYNEKAGTFEPVLPSRPEADYVAPDETDWLYDSTRTYFDQLDAYETDLHTEEKAS